MSSTVRRRRFNGMGTRLNPVVADLRWFEVFLLVLGLFLPSFPEIRAEVVGSWPGFPQGAVRQIAVVGDRAYVTRWPSAVAIFDVSDPDRPVRLGGCNLEGSAEGIQVVGQHAYVAAGSLQVLDVSDPRNPVRVGQASSSVQANSVRVLGDYAFLGGWKGFEVFHIHDPSSPVRVGLLRSESGGEVVEVSGQRAYVLAPGGITVLDVSDPARPTVMTSVNLGGLTGMQVTGDRVFLSRNFGGGLILDLTHPDAPETIGSLGGVANSIQVSGSVAYLINDVGGLTLFDVSNPSSPRALPGGGGGGLDRIFAVTGPRVFATDTGGVARIVDLTNPETPLERGRFAAPNYTQVVTVTGGFAYLCDSQGGFHILDVSQPSQPARIGGAPLPRAATDVAVTGRRACLVDGVELHVLDLSDPVNPVSVGKHATGHTRIRTVANVAVACGHWADNGEGRTLSLFDIRNPASVTLLGTVALPGHGRALDVAGDYGYVAMGGIGPRLAVIQINSPASPRLVGSYGTDGGATEVRVVGARAYLAVNQEATHRMGLEILDLSDPVRPVQLGFFQTQSAPTGLEVVNDVVHLALGERGVLQVDVRDPKNPVCEGGFDTPGFASAISVAGRHVFVSDGEFGLAIGESATSGVPYLVFQPESQVVDVGFGATFQVQAECEPLTYQWRFNGTNLHLATNDTLMLPTVTTNHAGLYSVVVGNNHGAVTSSVASLRVDWLSPLVSAAFADLEVEVGSKLSVVTSVIGSPPMAMQWLFNGQPIPGQTGPWLLVDNVETNRTGRYSLRVSNPAGVVVSREFTVTVSEVAPRVVVAPRIANVLVGEDLSLSPNQVTGAPFPSLQWQFNGVDLPGQTNAGLTLVRMQTNQSGSYSLVASNRVGVSASEAVRVSVELRAPEWVDTPLGSDLFATEGSEVIFRAKAVGGPPPVFHLVRDGTNVPVPYVLQRNEAVFHLFEVTTNDSGSYRIVASNVAGTTTSPATSLRVAKAGPLDRWTQRNPLPQSQEILSMVNANGLFVGVGDRGLVVTSPDGTNWSAQRQRVDVPLRGVAWGDGQFVAVGGGGVILGSRDGTNWTHRYSAPPSLPYTVGDSELRSVAYGNGRFVAVGNGARSTAYTSEDGERWDPHTIAGDPQYLSGIAFGDGRFVAVGWASYSSADGETWTPGPGPSAGPFDIFRSVQFLEDQFVAVGDNGGIYAWSGNEPGWSCRGVEVGRHFLGVTFGDGHYVAVGTRGAVSVSDDAVVWRSVESGTPDRLETITFAGTLFVAAGENGSILSSTNVTTWTRQNYGTTRDLDGMVVTPDLAVVVGKAGVILRSTDGENFVESSSGTTNNLHGIGWTNGLFVAVGERGEIITSQDAITWTRRESGSTNSLKAAAYGAGSWVVVGTQGTVLTSPDGATWTMRTIPGVLAPQQLAPRPDLNDVVWGSGNFVIVGDGPEGRDGSVFRSVNGSAWEAIPETSIDSRKRKNIRSVTFADGLFLATCNDGYLLTSTNAQKWSGRLCTAFEGMDRRPNLRDAHHAFGVWFVVGNEGWILTSTNTVDWTPRPVRALENLHGIGALRGRLLSIGNRGTILQSDQVVPVLEFPIGNPRTPRVPLRGVTEHTYRVEASSDLETWTLVATVTNAIRTDRPILVDDPAALAQPMRYYRVKEE